MTLQRSIGLFGGMFGENKQIFFWKKNTYYYIFQDGITNVKKIDGSIICSALQKKKLNRNRK